MVVRCWRIGWLAVLLLCWQGVAPWRGVSAHPAWGIRVSAEGEIFFADVERNRVWKISRRGTLIPLLKGKHSHDLWLDQAGNLFGEHVYWDAANERWVNSRWRFNDDEKLVELGAPQRGAGLTRDAVGNQFGVESDAQTVRLLKRAPNGQVTTIAGNARGYADGPGEQARFTLIEAMELGQDGALYVRDKVCIRRVALDGSVVTLGGNPLAGVARGEHPRILGLAADARGNVFVADTEQGVVRRIGPDNRVTTVLATGWFWTPTGVTVVNDELYVLENLPESPLMLLAVSGIGPYIRVQKIAADGSVRTLATVWGPTTRLLLGAAILLGALFALWRLRRREGHRELAV